MGRSRMSMPRRAVLVTAAWLGCAAATGAPPLAPTLGEPVSEAQLRRWDLTVFPDGAGLPPGGGTARQGAVLFANKCASCHGPGGRGATADELAGGRHPLDGPYPDKNVGNYWPFATTIFDFTRRAMPTDAPGSLSADEAYALTAYLLYANGIIGEDERMDAATLPKVRMPNRDGFDWIDVRPDGRLR